MKETGLDLSPSQNFFSHDKTGSSFFMKTVGINFGTNVTVCAQAREDASTASVLDLQEHPSIPNALQPATGRFGHDALEIYGAERFQRCMTNGAFVCDRQGRDAYDASLGFFIAIRKFITAVVFNGVSESFRTVAGCPSSCMEGFKDSVVRLFEQAGFSDVIVCPESEAALLFYHHCKSEPFHNGDHVAAVSADGVFLEISVMQIKNGVVRQTSFAKREEYTSPDVCGKRSCAADVSLYLKEAGVPITSFLLYGQDGEALCALKEELEKEFSCSICFDENNARTAIAQGLALFGRPLTLSSPPKKQTPSPRRALSWKKLATLLFSLFLAGGGCFLWSQQGKLLEKMKPAEVTCELCLEFSKNNTLDVYFNEENIWANSFTLSMSDKVFKLERPRATENPTGDLDMIRLKIGEDVLVKADPYLYLILRQKQGWLMKDKVFEKKAPLSEEQVRALKKGAEHRINFDGTGCSLVFVPTEEKGQ